MSEDWKNERAEADMRRHEAEMINKLNPKKNHVTKTWTITASVEGDDAESVMMNFENELIERVLQEGVTVIVSPVE